MQANFVAIPKADAFDFTLFCLRNPRPCPVLAILEPGQTDAPAVAANCDVRTDIPKYWVFENGEWQREAPDVCAEYAYDSGLVGCSPPCVPQLAARHAPRTERRTARGSFVLGCSFSFDALLAQAGLRPRHEEEGVNVPMSDPARPAAHAPPPARPEASNRLHPPR